MVTPRRTPADLHVHQVGKGSLLGPNGAGKSTLLRTVAGLQPLLAGAVTLDGTGLAALSPERRARRVAVVLTERVAPAC